MNPDVILEVIVLGTLINTIAAVGAVVLAGLALATSYLNGRKIDRAIEAVSQARIASVAAKSAAEAAYFAIYDNAKKEQP